MSGTYISICTINDPDSKYKFVGYNRDVVAIGTYHGCSCCRGDEPLTLELIDQHIDGLNKDLERALDVRALIQAGQSKPLSTGMKCGTCGATSTCFNCRDQR